MAGNKKQAVIFIHGMGEQVPMETLRSFVDSVWKTDDKLVSTSTKDRNTGKARKENPVWSKPDARNRSHELHRLTTEADINGRRTDFYEFYWAHLIHGTTWEHFKSWFTPILWRPIKHVPRDVFAAWVALWVITLSIFGFLIYSQFFMPEFAGIHPLWKVGTAGLTLVAALFVNNFLLKYFGDVARYVKAAPVNIAIRQNIREKGVELLETLLGIRNIDHANRAVGQQPKWNTKYDRIIIASHSLGTIVAYDILKATFARCNKLINTGNAQPHRHAMERLLADTIENAKPLDLKEFRRLQDLCRHEQNKQGNPWIVSDFVTLGSPLTHAEFLMAKSQADMREQQQKRILPTCPPVLEWDINTNLHHFSYWPGRRKTPEKKSDPTLFRYAHHSAHFAFTRWTNIYSKHRLIAWGDQISGPLGNHFDLKVERDDVSTNLKGIVDIQVLPMMDKDGTRHGRVPFFTHTKYWNASVYARGVHPNTPPYHIRQLRKALNLLDQADELTG